MTGAGRGSRLRTIAIAAASSAASLIIFAAFLAQRFPYGDTASALLAPYQLKLTYRAQHPRLPFGVRLEDARLIPLGGGLARPLLSSPEVVLSPVLSSALVGQPALEVSAELWAGTVVVRANKDANAINLAFSLDSVALDQCAPLQQFGPVFGGSLSGVGQAKVRGSEINDGDGTATIDGRDMTLEIARDFPLIHLGAVSGRLRFNSGSLIFQELESHGGDVDARADGAIQLAPKLGDSRISARVYFTPTASGTAHFGLFLKLLPHPPSEGPYYLHGPLDAPSLS